MPEKLTIRNFGPIPYLEIEIKRLSIFIGAQGSGKSTISKLLTIFRDISWPIHVIENTQPMEFFISLKIDKYFKPDTYLQYSVGKEVMSYENGKFTYQYSDLSEPLRTFVLNKFFNGCSSSLKKLGYKKLGDLRVSGNIEDVLSFMGTCRTMLYIPAERIMIGQLSQSLATFQVARVPLGDIILEYMSFFEKAKNLFPSYNIPFLNLKYENKNGRDYVSMLDNDRTSDIPLDSCSSGIQSVLPLIMVMDYCCRENYFNSFVVEEPEQNLFPMNQKELLRLIFRLWKGQTSKDTNMVITTHSPYTLTCVNVAMLAFLVGQNPAYSDAVAEIVPKEEWLDPDIVSVFSLDKNTDTYATSLINPKTKMIGINTIDSASDIISNEWGKLYKLYLKQLK